MKRFQPTYEAGVLKPLEQLSLVEQQVVTLFLVESQVVDIVDEPQKSFRCV